MNVIIRDANKSDACKVGTIHYSAWIETYTGMLPESYLATRSAEKSIELFKQNECKNVVVAEVEGEVVGFCGFGEFREFVEGDNIGEIQGIYLLDTYKRKHLGQKMIEYVIEELKEFGYNKVGLWVLESNKSAIRFYEKLGFAYSGRSKKVNLGEQITELLYIK